jgi:hypothetical protein
MLEVEPRGRWKPCMNDALECLLGDCLFGECPRPSLLGDCLLGECPRPSLSSAAGGTRERWFMECGKSARPTVAVADGRLQCATNQSLGGLQSRIQAFEQTCDLGGLVTQRQ